MNTHNATMSGNGEEEGIGAKEEAGGEQMGALNRHQRCWRHMWRGRKLEMAADLWENQTRVTTCVCPHQKLTVRSHGAECEATGPSSPFSVLEVNVLQMRQVKHAAWFPSSRTLYSVALTESMQRCERFRDITQQRHKAKCFNVLKRRRASYFAPSASSFRSRRRRLRT